MSKSDKPARPGLSATRPARPANTPEARLPRGFRDTDAAEARNLARMLAVIRDTYDRYGFEPLDTPAFEFTDALGKFLPDQDRPNEGVFSLQDEDQQWLSLRYDLTAPLARYVAENYATLPKPYRRYACGPVWRNEKPGPGRFRQFMQFDADTVGVESVAADAEICMLAADTLEALGLGGKYVMKVNNRKILDGVMEAIGLAGPENAGRRLTVLRAIDKFDKFGAPGVSLLLGAGRKDESGDFTKGAGLDAKQIDSVLAYLTIGSAGSSTIAVIKLARLIGGTASGAQGLTELTEMGVLIEAAGYGNDRIRIDTSVVRGLEYYTGPVFEAELTFEVKNDDGETVRFGSVGGGGRYDDLIARFTGERVPATGFSIGVSRLQTALRQLADPAADTASGPVVVLVMDKAELPRYQRLAQTLRQAGIRAEMYLGSSGMKAQMKYADRRAAPCVVIQGSDERARGEVLIKDLVEGARIAAAASTVTDNAAWKAARPAQVAVPEAKLATAVAEILARHAGA